MRTRRATAVAAPLGLGVAVVAAWQLLVSLDHVPLYIMPTPRGVVDVIGSNRSRILAATWVSGSNALIGLALGSTLAILAAFALQRSKALGGLLGALSAGVAAVPIVASAPLFYAMYSATSELPRRIVVAVLVFFPTYINVAKGLSQVPVEQRELMHCQDASRVAFARHIEIPCALPYLFAAFRLAAPAAVITSIVSEYFGGPENGLVSLITTAADNSDYSQAWAYVAASVFLGLAAYFVFSSVEGAVRRRGYLPA